MIDWKSLPAFLAAARNGSFRSAAAATGSTHATVRRQIETLEGRLRVQMFRRAGNGLHLTAAGRSLLPEALKAEEHLLKGFNAVQGLDREARGSIRLSADPMTAHYLLAPALSDFAALYPEIHIDLKLSYELDSIENMETDVSVRHVVEEHDNAVGRKLFTLSLGVFAARAYIDKALPKAGPKGQGLSWIGYGNVPVFRDLIAASPFPDAHVRHTIPDPQMHLHMARAGAGMTFLANWVQAKFPEIQRVPGTAFVQDRSTWLLMREDLRRVRRVRLLVDFLYAALQERRADFIGD